MAASLIYRTAIGGRLYQGGSEDIVDIGRQGFVPDLVVLTAMEFQPKIIADSKLARTIRPMPFMDEVVVSKGNFKVVYAPFLDTMAMTKIQMLETLKFAKEVASRVTKAVTNGETALVTCWEGRNRSGLVNGIAIKKMAPHLKTDEIVSLIRKRRMPQALSNYVFVELIRQS